MGESTLSIFWIVTCRMLVLDTSKIGNKLTMRVSNDITTVVNKLGSAVVVGLGVNETAGLEIGNLHSEGEGLVGFDNFAILGELEFRSWHVIG